MLDTLRPKVVVPDRFQDGPDMFRVTTTPTPDFHRGYSNVGLRTHDGELYKVRNMPHLYEEWHVKMVEDQRETYLSTLPDNVIDVDCHHCKSATLLLEDDPIGRCPNCGWKV